MPTLLVDPPCLDGSHLEVEGDAYRHLFRAQRLAVGDELRAVDGAGRARRAVVERVDRQRGHLRLGEPLPSLEPARRVELLVAPARLERASWLVEKATELGVAALRFVATERSAREFAARELERLRRVARAAVEQCGRSRVPEISGTHTFDHLSALALSSSFRLVLALGGPPLAVSPPGSDAAVLIGPEGGLTPAEEEQARALGFAPWGLGERILRIETAAVVASGLLLVGPSPTFS